MVTDHGYNAATIAVRVACERAGATMTVVRIPLPAEDVAERIDEALTDRTRLAIIDHVTSPTAAIFPIADVVAACKRRGVPILVDAAHAPGMLDVDVGSLGADWWTATLHKWVCGPKGSAVLWVAEQHRSRTRPVVASHFYDDGLQCAFAWNGTHDPTPYLSVPAAIDLLETSGWKRIRTYNHELVIQGRAIVADAIGAKSIVSDEATGSMVIIPLPDGTGATIGSAKTLQARILNEARVEVPVVAWNGRGFIRLSAQIYTASPTSRCWRQHCLPCSKQAEVPVRRRPCRRRVACRSTRDATRSRPRRRVSAPGASRRCWKRRPSRCVR